MLYFEIAKLLNVLQLLIEHALSYTSFNTDHLHVGASPAESNLNHMFTMMEIHEFNGQKGEILLIHDVHMGSSPPDSHPPPTP